MPALQRKIMIRVLRTCRACRCTEQDCMRCIKRTGGPCHWVEIDLCSACVGMISAPENVDAWLQGWDSGHTFHTQRISDFSAMPVDLDRRTWFLRGMIDALCDKPRTFVKSTLSVI